MDRTERVELTTLCMIYTEDYILLQNRRKKDWKGYTFPGGHVEPGESFVDAVTREIREETGLEIETPALCGIKQFPIEGGRYMVLLYKTDKFSGTLCSSDEGNMEWVPRNCLPRIDLVEDFMDLLKVFDDPVLTEFQYLVDGEDWSVNLR